LKGLITEATIFVEPKNVDGFTVPNRMRIMMSSNEDWFVPAGADERRFFLLEVGEKHKQDTAYFGAIEEQMSKGGLAALLYFPQHCDLAAFEIRKVTQTTTLADQKPHSRRGIDALVEHFAHAGELPEPRPGYPHMCITSVRDGRKSFHQHARTIAPDLKHITDVNITRHLKTDWGCKAWRANGINGIVFPPLLELRKKFDDRHGAQQWDRPKAEWGDEGEGVAERGAEHSDSQRAAHSTHSAHFA